ncbi:MAG: rod shape-determining protein MreD [Methylobacter tundripaludum]|nr:rod shape-determining protein MreD [Methylobacter tundripaludum]
MCLRVIRWHNAIASINTDWVLLVLVYCTLAMPERVGIFHAWTVGLLTDALTGGLFGQYALAYSLAIYFCLILHKRLRQYPLPQQSMFIFLCLLSTQLLLFWLKNIQTPSQFHASFWLPVFTGTLCWPLVYTALRFVRLARFTK